MSSLKSTMTHIGISSKSVMISDISCVKTHIGVDGGLYADMIIISLGTDILTATTSQPVLIMMGLGHNDW